MTSQAGPLHFDLYALLFIKFSFLIKFLRQDLTEPVSVEAGHPLESLLPQPPGSWSAVSARVPSAWRLIMA